MAVGQGLFQEVVESEAEDPRILAASETSCHEQLRAGLHRQVYRPAELPPAAMAGA